MNVKFLKGLSSSFVSLTKDSNTFYYLTDSNALYLGDKLIGNGVSLNDFNSLKDRVKSLEDWKLALPEYVTKAVYDQHLIDQAAIDKKQTDDIAQLRTDLEGVVAEGGEPNKVDDVQVNGVSVVTDKVANIVLGDLASKDSVATGDINDDAVTADKLADSINTDIAKGVEAQSWGDHAKAGYLTEHQDISGKADRSELNAYMTTAAHETFVSENAALQSGITAAKVNAYDVVKATVDAFFADKESVDTAYDTLQEIAAYLSGGEGENAKDVVTRIAAIESDISANRDAWAKDDNTTYSADESSIALSGTVFSVKDTYIDGRINDKITAFETANSTVLTSGISAAKVSDYDTVKSTVDSNKATWDKAGTAVQPEALEVYAKSADLGDLARKNESELNLGQYAKSADLGTAAAKNVEFFDAAGAAAAVQGATTNTVKDCVDAINKMNGKTGEVIGTVENIVDHLTWGTF